LIDTKKPLILIGHRSGLDTILEIIEELEINFIGIYDKYFYGNTDSIHGIPFIGSEDNISESDIKNCNFFLSSGWAGHANIKNPEHNGDNLRQTRINIFKEKNLSTINLINPHSYVHKSSLELMGKGIVVGRGCQIRARVQLGDFSYIDNLSSIGHDVTVGENLVMPPYSFVGGHIDFGDNVMIGAGSTIVNKYHDRNLKIGNDVKILAGSTVMKNVADGKTFAAISKTRMLDRID
jgi:acetyltransferase-like isoleucine patch superfamily enzyme